MSLAQLVSQYDGSDRAQLVRQYGGAVAISLNGNIDGSNVDVSASTITDPTASEPLIEIEFRSAAITGTNGSGWRHTGFEVVDGEGKRPTFRLNRADMDRASFTIPNDWVPMYTQDFVTWTRAPSRTLSGGSTGYIEFQFAGAFPAGDIFVVAHPYGRQSDAEAFAAELLTDYSTVAEPTASADVNGVYNTTPTEVDENDRAIGAHPQHGIKLAWGGATTDGLPKRKLVMMSGLHAAGEQICWLPFTSAVRWFLDDASEAAGDFRSNWDVWIFFNITANGAFGGHRRHNFRSSVDPNRDFINRTLNEVDELRTVAEADAGTDIDCFITWHGHNGQNMSTFIPGKLTSPAGSPTAQDTAFIALGETIFGVTAAEYSAGSDGTDTQWGRNVLSAKVSLIAEIWQRTSTDPDSYPVIGQNWAKTIQAADAAGLFTTPTLSAVSAESRTSSSIVPRVTVTF